MHARPTLSRSRPSDPDRLRGSTLSLLLLAALACGPVVGCGGAGAGGSAGEGADPEGVWESLRSPRPEPLDGAARVTVSDLTVLGQGRWDDNLPVPTALGLQELVSLNLLRRRDVHFVERRRFTRAAERERRGEPRPDGAPPVGRSPGAELVLTGTWIPAGADSASLDLRLTDAESGRVVRSWRTPTPADADLPSLARAAAGSCLRALQEMQRRPEWDDPLRSSTLQPAPAEYRPASVPSEAVVAFLRGLEAEDRYEWNRARREYQQAIEMGGSGFFEPDVALSRAARLRAGGTLGANQ